MAEPHGSRRDENPMAKLTPGGPESVEQRLQVNLPTKGFASDKVIMAAKSTVIASSGPTVIPRVNGCKVISISSDEATRTIVTAAVIDQPTPGGPDM